MGATASCRLLVGRRLIGSPGGFSNERAGDGPPAYTARAAVLLLLKPTASQPLLILPPWSHP